MSCPSKECENASNGGPTLCESCVSEEKFRKKAEWIEMYIKDVSVAGVIRYFACKACGGLVGPGLVQVHYEFHQRLAKTPLPTEGGS